MYVTPAFILTVPALLQQVGGTDLVNWPAVASNVIAQVPVIALLWRQLEQQTKERQQITHQFVTAMETLTRTSTEAITRQAALLADTNAGVKEGLAKLDALRDRLPPPVPRVRAAEVGD